MRNAMFIAGILIPLKSQCVCRAEHHETTYFKRLTHKVHDFLHVKEWWMVESTQQRHDEEIELFIAKYELQNGDCMIPWIVEEAEDSIYREKFPFPKNLWQRV